MAALDLALIGAIIICIASLGMTIMAYTKPDIKLHHDKNGDINPNEASISHYLESKDGIDFMNKYIHDEKFLDTLDFVKKHNKIMIKSSVDVDKDLKTYDVKVL